MALLRVDYDGADTLLRAIEHGLPLEVLRKIVVVVAVIDAGRNVLHRRLEEGRRRTLLRHYTRRNGAEHRSTEARNEFANA